MNSDKQWGRLNARLQELIKAENFWGLGGTYYEMADFVEKEGKDPAPYRKLGYEAKLRVVGANLKNMLKSNVLTGVEILATPESCEPCKELNGKRFSVAEIKKTPILPVGDCSYPYGCRCTYTPTVD